jgi:hypothetical protein
VKVVDMEIVSLAICLALIALIMYGLSKLKLISTIAVVFLAVVMVFLVMTFVPALQIEPVYGLLKGFFEGLPDLLSKAVGYISKMLGFAGLALGTVTVSKGVNVYTPTGAKDKLFIVMLVAAGICGLWLSLQSAGFLLAFNVNTLLVATIIFTVTSSSYLIRGKPWQQQLTYASLALAPIFLRAVLNMPFFQSYTASTVDIVNQALFALQIIALWVIVAVCEEAFRATMIDVGRQILSSKFQGKILTLMCILLANVLWILFHFIQRPFDPFAYKYYIIWLFCSGLVLGWLVERAGLGSAAFAHFLINITA